MDGRSSGCTAQVSFKKTHTQRRSNGCVQVPHRTTEVWLESMVEIALPAERSSVRCHASARSFPPAARVQRASLPLVHLPRPRRVLSAPRLGQGLCGSFWVSDSSYPMKRFRMGVLWEPRNRWPLMNHVGRPHFESGWSVDIRTQYLRKMLWPNCFRMSSMSSDVFALKGPPSSR